MLVPLTANVAVWFAYLIFKEKISKIVFPLIFIVPMALFFAFSIHENIEPYVSSKNVCAYIKENYALKSPLICSKFFARGIRYFTDSDLLILDIPAGNFFSPHPFVFLDSADKIKAHLDKYPDTFFILNKHYTSFIKERFSDKYSFAVFKQFGNVYLLQLKAKTSA